MCHRFVFAEIATPNLPQSPILGYSDFGSALEQMIEKMLEQMIEL
jgi:hypothetical protein